MATPEENQPIIDEFRANAGAISAYPGWPVLLLTTTGVRSGLPRTSPVIYLADGDRYLVFASAGGAPTNPAWFGNLVAQPHVTVEVGAETFAADATVLAGTERDDAYARQVAAYSIFGGFQERTDRIIPVVALTRRA